MGSEFRFFILVLMCCKAFLSSLGGCGAGNATWLLWEHRQVINHIFALFRSASYMYFFSLFLHAETENSMGND